MPLINSQHEMKGNDGCTVFVSVLESWTLDMYAILDFLLSSFQCFSYVNQMRHATSKICAATLEQFMSITTSTIYGRNPKALLRVLIKGGCPFCFGLLTIKRELCNRWLCINYASINSKLQIPLPHWTPSENLNYRRSVRWTIHLSGPKSCSHA